MKSKKVFEAPFIGFGSMDGVTLLYTADGSYSSMLKLDNLAEQYSADSSLYELYHSLLGQAIKLLGDGFIIQKTDVISRQSYKSNQQSAEYLDQKYFQFFEGRSFISVSTYLTITKPSKNGKLLAYSEDGLKSFANKIYKIIDAFEVNKISIALLSKQDIRLFLTRYIGFSFHDNTYSLDNFSCDANGLYYGQKQLKVISLIDIDELNLPNEVSTHTYKNDLGKNYPVDNFTFLTTVPEADVVLYNQVVFIPDQLKMKRDLEIKSKRHSSMPDPANKISVEDINDMFIDIARQNELLVYGHFSILVFSVQDKINLSLNYIETQLFARGIIAGKNAYNQLELFRAAIPGNAGELKNYDKFLTSRPSAICFFFKERMPKSDDSNYLLYFTDRQGVPIGIDTSEKPMHTNRINNRNKFILGPSGSGKSFFTNRYVKQCRVLGADVVLVDTGHSYLGLCNYFKGKYITYKEDRPITMNPFKINEVENNEEKRQILKSLIGLIWKGTDGMLSQVEDSIIGSAVNSYFSDYFGAKEKVTSLSFDSFYEFACAYSEDVVSRESLNFDTREFKFILKKFYRGGEYERVLNDDFDSTLFNEPFIVFEIDSIKEHKLLFPITTLIIMDVFLQKMRYKKNKKILIIEEAWKAIASPMMAGYILYLYKTVRKFNGEAIVVTQELNDIIGNAIVKDSILANSDTICLLDQSKFRDNFDVVSNLLSLSEIEKNKIFTINKLDNKEGRVRFKEVYIRRGAVGEVYGVEVPIEEYLTYTTEFTEKEAVAIYLEQYLHYEKALDAFVMDMKTSKLSLPQFVALINQQRKIYSSSKNIHHV
ncbi:MAG: TraG family conjugative transposon ATPase [Bacteroidota bacterium]|nr:TraG family conjugative transposon ATPase [Bacteroidota bacterium]